MCWILKLLYNKIFGKFDWVLHLEIYKSLTLIQLLTHYTKSFLRSLINQLITHSLTSYHSFSLFITPSPHLYTFITNLLSSSHTHYPIPSLSLTHPTTHSLTHSRYNSIEISYLTKLIFHHFFYTKQNFFLKKGLNCKKKR